MFGFDINGSEFLLLLLVAFLLIGPERLPSVLADVRRYVVQLRRMAEGAKTQLRDQMGPEFDDIDWKAYDPRQYDPRRIVREAMAAPLDEDGVLDTDSEENEDDMAYARPAAVYDPSRPVPYDTDAT